ncbi:alpha-amylase family glycosyl hydrolase [Bifidobacterium adolescentis]|uniref:Alpha-amylase family glycosyl hydrolase n=1 Tax=Bifidobacterium adolescentis TaxID=1680 RepID=A0ABM8IRZ5_BIFAD|nr:alpha-amylase family glycosyl hydrolase [Bifidobacterium faecale]
MVTANNMRDDWWKQAVVYQIYPRSFKDVNGDGLGDIAGVTEKMDYLKNLGIDAIWLSPFYPSDLADGGYDVIDYRNVDPRLGTMADFDAMAAAAHEAGIKVIVDIVPNHTSNKHKMFIEALAAGRGSAARDRYIFREGRGEHGELPPNDWQSLFGGPAWQQVDDGQWYLHMFAKEQPDLNWKNPDVHEEFKKTLRFWSDHGTDGFRIDVAHGLAKDLDSVPLADMDPAAVQHVLPADGAFSPLWDRPEVHDIYREWRQVFNEYNPPRFAVGEAWVKAESQHLYASTDELGQVFNFEFAEANWFADEFRTAIADGLRAAEETHGSTTTWVMNNHDVPRSPSRFGLPQVEDAPYHQLAHDWLLRDGETYRENRELGTRRARAAALMELGLPGSAYVYQGEELGLFEVANIPWDRLEDPTPFNTRRNFTDKGRDGCRAPMPWKAADCGEPASWSPDFITGGTFGFGPEQGDSADAHLPQPAWFKDFAADVEADDNGSMLHLYRKLLQLRQTVLTATGDTSADLLDMGDTVVAYSRPATEGRRFLSVTNFGDEPIALPDDAVAIANSVPLTDDGKLDSDASVWLLLG